MTSGQVYLSCRRKTPLTRIALSIIADLTDIEVNTTRQNAFVLVNPQMKINIAMHKEVRNFSVLLFNFIKFEGKKHNIHGMEIREQPWLSLTQKVHQP